MNTFTKSLERNIFIVFILALAIILSICALLSYNILQFLEANRMVQHTYQVIEKIEETASELRNRQIERFNYAVSGDENSFSLHQSELQVVDRDLAELRQLVADNTAQQQNLDVLTALVNSRRESTSKVFDLRRGGNRQAALETLVSETNPDTADKIETTIASMKESENVLLINRSEKLIDSQQRALSIIIGFGALMLILLVIAYFYVRLSVKKRQAVQREIKSREGLYRTLVRNIPKTAVILIDREMRYTLADGMQLEKHGFSQEMFEGKTLYEVFPADISAEWEKYYERAFAGEHITI